MYTLNKGRMYFTMKKVKTLKKNYEFKNAFDKGKYVVNRQVIVYIKKNKLGYNRIGIAIGTKLCDAVKRNHLKRLIREAYYSCEKNLASSDFYDFVFTWNKKANVDEASYFKILNDLNRTFEKLGIIDKKQE